MRFDEIAWGKFPIAGYSPTMTERDQVAFVNLLQKMLPNGKSERYEVDKSFPGGHPGSVDVEGVCSDIIFDSRTMEHSPEGYIKVVYDSQYGAVKIANTKGVYKNCRGIWAAQWADDMGRRHTKYFNPKHFSTDEIARICAYRYRIAVTKSLSRETQTTSKSHIRKYRKNRMRRRANRKQEPTEQFQSLLTTSSASPSEASDVVVPTDAKSDVSNSEQSTFEVEPVHLEACFAESTPGSFNDAVEEFPALNYEQGGVDIPGLWDWTSGYSDSAVLFEEKPFYVEPDWGEQII